MCRKQSINMSFDYSSIDLPITEIIPRLKESLSLENTVILNAPPGAGKSTLLPLALKDEVWLNAKKIILLEPRRLAAKSVAERLAQLHHDAIGQTVGYRIRFETKISKQTQIEVVTEGILTRMIQSDNELQDVGLIIFDEFHERSIHADVALALCRESQKILRPDLRILVMSATLDMPQLSKMLNAPVIQSKGRQYPVEIKYVGGQDQRMMPQMTAKAVINAVTEHPGDALVFLPGQGEIRQTEELLKSRLKDFEICPLYGQLPFSVQQKAIYPNKEGKRKIVLATSIAETSLTIEGITMVIDTGFGRNSKFDPKTGLSKLMTHQISEDSADQRAGRAGRLGPGVCYRMWHLADQLRLEKHRTPEILEADLAALMLDMAAWGIRDINQLTWLNTPPTGAVSQGQELLKNLGATVNGVMTQHGRKIHQLPCHPRLAHMLIKAEEQGLLPLATDLAALLEERDPLPPHSGVDINLRIEALRRFRKNNAKGGRISGIERIASQYRKICQTKVENNAVDDFETGILIAQAYPERIACARPGNNAQFQLSNGKIANMPHQDDLANEPWLAVAHVNARDGMGNIFLASPLNPKDLQPFVKQTEILTWDTKQGGLIASLDTRIGNIILESKPLHHPDQAELADAICSAIKKEGTRLLNFNENFGQWQNRILSLKAWNPEQAWPDYSTEALLQTCEIWLKPYLSGVKKPEDLQKLNLKEILFYSLSPKHQQSLNSLAPETINVPTGSAIKIKYFPRGEQPVLAVRLQELFGLSATPTVNSGQEKLLIHLLSPGYKPVQVTSDLASFWSDTYFEVRSELKRRYSKHYWPDNPLKAEPQKGAKRRK